MLLVSINYTNSTVALWTTRVMVIVGKLFDYSDSLLHSNAHCDKQILQTHIRIVQCSG